VEGELVKKVAFAIILAMVLVLIAPTILDASTPFQVVIDKTTKDVKRFGYCDFENDGSFDSETEEIIEHYFVFDPRPSATVTWRWNSSLETFEQV
jgi:hypothetical protein